MEGPEVSLKGSPTVSPITYPGKANWIWADGFATPFAKVRLAREFTVSGKVKSARLIISADDVYQVWINGKPADKDFPKSGTWEIADVLDVTALLNEGSNTIAILGEDGGTLPCGVIADLQISCTDGKVINLITDKSWKGAAAGNKNWDKPAEFNKWHNAVIIAPYGAGAWSNRMKMKNNNVSK